jgi:two-component system nitrogen regulation sensor histidine kinase GlnL
MKIGVAEGAANSSSDSWVEHLATGVAMLDARLRFVYANSAFCELFEVGASKLRELALGEFSAIGHLLLPIAQRANAQEGAIAARAERVHTTSGRVLEVDIVASPWVDGGILLEVHRLTSAQASPMPARVSESLRGLAHEVRNPLAGVRGAAQLLKRRLTDPALTHLADLIIGESDRLVALANRLLHAGGKPHLAPVNLHAVIERARALIAAESVLVKLDRDYDPSLPSFPGDADRLLQLLLNLMRNSIQANAESIHLRTRAEHHALIGDQPARLALRVDVIDDGNGVAEELRDTLFLPLVSGRPDGTGLGLALAQEIAHEHGGSIVHDSRHAGGDRRTIFTLLLPIGGDHG